MSQSVTSRTFKTKQQNTRTKTDPNNIEATRLSRVTNYGAKEMKMQALSEKPFTHSTCNLRTTRRHLADVFTFLDYTSIKYLCGIIFLVSTMISKMLLYL